MNTTFLKWLVIGAAPVIAVGVGAVPLGRPATLVEIVRDATERFHDPDEATAAGYAAMPSCVSGPEEGAMGVHYVDGALVGDGELDAERPEALVYEVKNGRLRLVAVEYIVPADLWNAKHPTTPPILAGQHFHLVSGPNRYGPAAFYELHVWAWKNNPKGTFVDWNPRVSCDDFTVADSLHSGH